MRFRLNVITRIALCAFLVFVLPQGIKAESLPPADYEALDSSVDSTGSDCVSIQLDMTATNTMPVPSGCVGGLCKLILYTNDAIGAFGPGYSMETYYYQWSSGNDWIGGPNVELGGYEFSDGYGGNGNGIGEGVLKAATTSDGGYVRIMDDGAAENDPNLWTIESRASASLTSASLHVCAMPGCQIFNIGLDNVIIDVPNFCIDGLCMILRLTYADFGAYGLGFSLPVYYEQSSATDDWIGGPQIALGGIDFSAGWGENGTGGMTPIFSGGTTAGGEYARLLDDGAEWSDSQWSVDLNTGDTLDYVGYAVCPMGCTKHTISAQYTNLATPSYCVDSLCTIVRWTDAWFGAWGPGLSWPVSYKQKSTDNSWIGGPAISIGGSSFSDGSGINGNTAAEKIFDSGFTTHEGYVILRDDSVTAGETGASQWNVVFNNQEDLTAASYYICSNDCQETIFLINKQFLPLAER